MFHVIQFFFFGDIHISCKSCSVFMCAEIHRLAFKIGKRTPYEIQTNKTSKTKKGRYFARQPLNINFTDSNI